MPYTDEEARAKADEIIAKVTARDDARDRMLQLLYIGWFETSFIAEHPNVLVMLLRHHCTDFMESIKLLEYTNDGYDAKKLSWVHAARDEFKGDNPRVPSFDEFCSWIENHCQSLLTNV